MKKYILIIIAIVFAPIVFAQSALKIKGDSLYTAGNYVEASNTYRQILDQGFESADLYYNLGNAYYKQGLLSSAILYYEKTLKLRPFDKDARYNLELSQQYTVDKIDVLDEFFLKKWVRLFRNTFTSDGWASLSIVLFIGFIVLLTVFTFSGRAFVKRISFYLGVFFLLGTITGVWGAFSGKRDISENIEAIVFSPTVTIKGSPDEKGTDLFILHEGVKVGVIDSVGVWRRIEMMDGNVGWLKETDIRKI